MNLPPLPEQSCWLLVMHGHAVGFANNAEKAAGMSPGASTQAFTADQMRAYAAEAVRVALDDAAATLAQAVCDDCDDCENGVKWLNEAASAKFAKDYPHLRAALNALKGTP